MDSDNHLTQIGHVFVPSHNPGDHPSTLVTAQEQTLGTEMFFKPKNCSDSTYYHCCGLCFPVTYQGPTEKVWTSRGPVDFESSIQGLRRYLRDQSGRRCGQDDWVVQPRGTPNPTHRTDGEGSIVRTSQGKNYSWCKDDLQRDHPSGKTAIFDDDVWECRQQPANLNTWVAFNVFFHRAHWEQRSAVTTAGKVWCTAEVKNIYDVPPPAPPEEHNSEIDSLHSIAQGMKDHIHEMDWLAQAKAVLTSTNTALMTQLAQLTSAIGDM